MNLDLQELVKYEIYSSWWAKHIGWKWGQDLAGKYFAWKTTRKRARYIKRKKISYMMKYAEDAYKNRDKKRDPDFSIYQGGGDSVMDYVGESYPPDQMPEHDWMLMETIAQEGTEFRYWNEQRGKFVPKEEGSRYATDTTALHVAAGIHISAIPVRVHKN